MHVRLKLFASYRRHLPPDSEGGVCVLEVPVETQAADLLARYAVPTAGGASVILVNGINAAPDQILEDGDTVAAFPALAGG